MGWSFFCSPAHDKAALLRDLRSPGHLSPGWTQLESRVVGNHHWSLIQAPDGRKLVALDLMAGGGRQGMGWGYKSISEDMGPCYYDCPLSLLDRADEPTGHASEWRRKVREYHAAKKAKAPRPGLVVRYGSNDYRLLHPEGPRLGWAVVSLSDGCQYRMKARQLAQAEAVQAEAQA